MTFHTPFQTELSMSFASASRRALDLRVAQMPAARTTAYISAMAPMSSSTDQPRITWLAALTSTGAAGTSVPSASTMISSVAAKSG